MQTPGGVDNNNSTDGTVKKVDNNGGRKCSRDHTLAQWVHFGALSAHFAGGNLGRSLEGKVLKTER
jgi:hypothetical protein